MTPLRAFTLSIRALKLDLSLGITWLTYLWFVIIAFTYTGTFSLWDFMGWADNLFYTALVLSFMWVPGAITWFLVKHR